MATVYAAATLTPLHRVAVQLPRHADTPKDIWLDDTATQLLIACDGVRVFDLRTGETSLSLPDARLSAVDSSGAHLAVYRIGPRVPVVEVWSLSTLCRVAAFPVAGKLPSALRFAPDGRSLGLESEESTRRGKARYWTAGLGDAELSPSAEPPGWWRRNPEDHIQLANGDWRLTPRSADRADSVPLAGRVSHRKRSDVSHELRLPSDLPPSVLRSQCVLSPTDSLVVSVGNTGKRVFSFSGLVPFLPGMQPTFWPWELTPYMCCWRFDERSVQLFRMEPIACGSRRMGER